MGIGVAMFLLAAGAILTFAVHASVTGVSLVVIGIILMVAGAIGLIVTLAIFTPRRHSVVTEERSVRDPDARERVVERHDIY